MASLRLALPTVGRPTWAVAPATPSASSQPGKVRRQVREGDFPLCRASARRQEEKSVTESSGVSTRVGGAIVPLLAAALVGGAPVLEAVMAPSMAIAVDVDNISGQDTYKDLITKIKERKARERAGVTDSSPAQAPAPEQETVASRLREAAEKARKEREANEARVAEARAETRRSKEVASPPAPPPAPAPAPAPAPVTARSIVEKEKAVVEKAGAASSLQKDGVPTITMTKKTHGFLPLFVSQFFLLLATVGAGYAIFVLPQSRLKEVQDKFDEFVEKATPVAEDAYVKAKPVADKAWQKAQEVGVQAKPYVIKAWEGAKPLATKAVEASKPLVKQARVKANDLLQQAQERSK